MDIADDNLTLPLPSALVKRQLQRGVGFLVDDGDAEEEMDMTQVFGGISPTMDGVNRFLNGDDDQTMEFTQVYSANNQPKSDNKNDQIENDTLAMEFTRVVGGIQGLRAPDIDKENLPPISDDEGPPTPMNDS